MDFEVEDLKHVRVFNPLAASNASSSLGNISSKENNVRSAPAKTILTREEYLLDLANGLHSMSIV